MSRFMEKKAQQSLLKVLKSFQEAFNLQDNVNKMQDDKNKIYDDFCDSQIKINIEVLGKLNDILSRLDLLECSK